MRTFIMVLGFFTFMGANVVPAAADQVAAIALHDVPRSYTYAGFGPHVVLNGAAPGDEYFGPLGMSVFGIRNTLRVAASRVDTNGIDRVDNVSSVALVELAIRAWEKKYPHDAWLPASVLALRTVYHQLATTDSDWKAADATSWLLKKYGASAEAQSLHVLMQRESVDKAAICAAPQLIETTDTQTPATALFAITTSSSAGNS